MIAFDKLPGIAHRRIRKFDIALMPSKHFLSRLEDSMKTFAVEVRIHGTIYIKAPHEEKAQRHLKRLCSNTLDARDRRWFSEASFEGLPRASFATSLLADAAIPNARMVEVRESLIDLGQRQFLMGCRDYLLPHASWTEQFADMPIFTTDVDLTTTAFIKADNLAGAETILEQFQGSHIDLEMEYWRWFSKLGLDEDEGFEFPLVLSSALYLVGQSEGCTLYRRWPEIKYRTGEDGTWIEIKEKLPYNPAWEDIFVDGFI